MFFYGVGNIRKRVDSIGASSEALGVRGKGLANILDWPVRWKIGYSSHASSKQ